MPPTPPAEGVLRVALHGSWSGGAVGGTRLFLVREDVAGAWPSTDLDALMAAFTTLPNGFWSQMETITSTAFTYNEVEMTDLSTGGLQISQSLDVSGIVSGDALPPQCAVCISWLITARWRGGKPRTYLPGIPLSALTTSGGSALTTAYMNDVASVGNNILLYWAGVSLPSASTVEQVCLSYRTAGAPRISPVTFPIVGAECHGRLDSQRRRSGKESAFPFS